MNRSLQGASRAELRRAARAYAERGESQRAVPLLERLAKDEPLNGDPVGILRELAAVSRGRRRIEHLRRAARVAKRKGRQSQARVLTELGEALYEEDEDHEAEKVLRQAVDLWVQVRSASDEVHARGLHAHSLVAVDKRREAALAFRAAVEKSRSDRLWDAELHWAGHWLAALGGTTDSAPLTAGTVYGHVNVTPRNVEGATDREVVAQLYQLASAYRSLGERDLAQGALREAFSQVRPAISFIYAALVNQQAALDFEMGLSETAILGHREAIRIALGAGEPHAAVMFRSDLAYVADALGTEDAGSLLAHVADEAVNARMPDAASWACRRLARRRVQEGELRSAVVFLSRAVDEAARGASAVALVRSAHGAALTAAVLRDQGVEELFRRASLAAEAIRDASLQEKLRADIDAVDRGDTPAILAALSSWAGVTDEAFSAYRWVESLRALPVSTASQSLAEALVWIESRIEAGAMDEAIDIATEALAEPEVAHEPAIAFQIRLLLLRATMLVGTRPREALDLAHELVADASTDHDRDVAARMYAEASAAAGRSRDALAVLDDRLTPDRIATQPLSDDLRALLFSRARIYEGLGDIRAAYDDLDRVGRGDGFEERGLILQLRGILAEAEEKPHSAAAFLKEALEAARLSGDDHFAAVVAVDYARNLADAEDDVDDEVDALLDHAIAILELTGDLTCLARAREHQRHRADDSAAWFEEQIALRREAGRPSDLAVTLTHAASEAESDRAIALLREAVELYRDDDSNDGLVWTLQHLVYEYLAYDDERYLPDAERISKELVDLVERGRTHRDSAQSRQNYLETHGNVYPLRALVLALCGRGLEGFDVAELGRARVLGDALTHRGKATPIGSRSALHIELAQAARDLRNARADGRPDKIVDAEMRVTRLERLLAQETGAPNPAATAAVTARDVTAVLDSGTALVSYISSGNAVFAFVITDEVDMAQSLSVSEASVMRRAAELTKALSDRRLRFPHGASLWEDLVRPLLPRIGARDIVILADGPLQTLPWGVLFTSPPDRHESRLDEEWRRTTGLTNAEDGVALTLSPGGAYKPPAEPSLGDWLRIVESVGAPPFQRSEKLPHAVRQRAIAVLPSAAAFVRLRTLNRGDAPRSVAVIGNPRVGEHAVDPRLATAHGFRAGMAPLPHTVDEAWRVARQYQRALPKQRPERYDGPRVRVRLGSAATRREVLDLLSDDVQPDVVHVASHGLVDVDEPLFSAIVLTGDDPADAQLILADVLDLDLDAHIVLSCCETGVGRVVDGEGVLGLARAFLAAGARSVCASLWKVQDEATPPLMEEYHKRLSEGQSPMVSLRRAQMEVMKRRPYPHPADWAAFSVVSP